MTLHGFSQSDVMTDRFFSQALSSNALAHAYLFKGKPIDIMYETALRLAQVLNCGEKPQADTACGSCQNCRWIEKNAHPAVITLSRLTQLDPKSLKKVEQQKGRPLTKIATDQITGLLGQLSMSSPYFRVVIITDLEPVPETSYPMALPPAEWANDEKNQGKHLALLPLNRKILDASPANKMLKTLEEPLPETLFIFLTDSEENLLDTIVSRCQSLSFTHQPDPQANRLTAEQLDFFQRLMPQITAGANFYPLVSTFKQTLIVDGQLTTEQALDTFQRFLHQAYGPETASSQQDFRWYRQRQQDLEQAKRMLKAHTNEEQVLNQVFYHLTQGVSS